MIYILLIYMDILYLFDFIGFLSKTKGGHQAASLIAITNYLEM